MNDTLQQWELDLLTEKYQARIIHVVSDEPEFAGEKGRIDEEKIKQLVPDFAEREVYLCGPPPMMEGLIALLRRLGVSAPQIHYERFAL